MKLFSTSEGRGDSSFNLKKKKPKCFKQFAGTKRNKEISPDVNLFPRDQEAWAWTGYRVVSAFLSSESAGELSLD